MVHKAVVSKMTSLSHTLKIDFISLFKDPGEQSLLKISCMMKIRSFFRAISSQPTDVMSSQSEDAANLIQSIWSQVQKKTVHKKRWSKWHPATSNRKYNKKREETFNWLFFDDNFQGAFCKVCRKRETSLQRTEGTWISKPFKN